LIGCMFTGDGSPVVIRSLSYPNSVREGKKFHISGVNHVLGERSTSRIRLMMRGPTIFRKPISSSCLLVFESAESRKLQRAGKVAQLVRSKPSGSFIVS